MTTDELETLLIEWGALSKYEQAKREGQSDFHVLQRGRQFAPGTRARAAQRLAGRDGFQRRSLMAKGLAECGVQVVGAAFVDPVPCSETRIAGPVQRPQSIVPTRLRPVYDAARELYRVDTQTGLVLRQEYCGYGPQTEKAERVGVALGTPIGLRVYRESLARAKGWMHAKLLAA